MLINNVMIFKVFIYTKCVIFCLGEEFCAALKIPFPEMKVYERKKKHKKDVVDGQKYRFKHTDTIRNRV